MPHLHLFLDNPPILFLLCFRAHLANLQFDGVLASAVHVQQVGGAGMNLMGSTYAHLLLRGKYPISKGQGEIFLEFFLFSSPSPSQSQPYKGCTQADLTHTSLAQHLPGSG